MEMVSLLDLCLLLISNTTTKPLFEAGSHKAEGLKL